MEEGFVAIDQDASGSCVEVDGIRPLGRSLNHHGSYLPFPDEIQYESIDNERSKLLHQIQRQGWSSSLSDVERSQIGVETRELDGRQDVVQEERVAEGEHCVQWVGRWVEGTPLEAPRMLEDGTPGTEVACGCSTLIAAHDVDGCCLGQGSGSPVDLS